MEELTKLEINMATVTTDIKYIKKSLEKNDLRHKEVIQKIDAWIIAADKKYSPIWVAKLIVWGSTIIGASILISLLALIGRIYLHLY